MSKPLNSPRKRLWVRFDPNGPGSRQHYFHFLLGYLLPSLDCRLRDPAVEQTVFVSCGPVMDCRTREAARLLNQSFIIAQVDLIPDAWSATTREVLAPRWDRWLMSGLNPGAIQHLPRNDTAVQAIRHLRQQFLSAAAATAAVSSAATEDEGDWLLLRRSAQPDFYRPGGAAEIAYYGSGRRAIAHLDRLAADLTTAGLPVRIYEPGAHSLREQISTFAKARGIIGIRGAEFANVLWMKPGAQALMLATPVKRENHASKNLAALIGIRFHLMPVASTYPQVEASVILNTLDAHTKSSCFKSRV